MQEKNSLTVVAETGLAIAQRPYIIDCKSQNDEMTLNKKLEILSDAAKYFASILALQV